MEFTKEELGKLINEVASTTAEKVLESRGACPFDKDCPCDTEAHKLQHEWVKEMIQVMRKVNQVKWGVIKAVTIAVVLAMIGLLGINGVKGG